MEELTKKEKAQLLTKSKSWSKKQWEKHLEENEPLEEMREDPLPENFDEIISEEFGMWKGKEKSLTKNIDLENICINAINKLTRKQKIVIKLTFYEGLTQKQIAEKLGVSRSSVKTIKHQSLQKLRRFLSPKLSPKFPIVGGGVMEKLIFQFPKNLNCSRNSYFKKPAEQKSKTA